MAQDCFIDDTPPVVDLRIYAGEAPKIVFEIDTDLTGASATFTIRGADDELLGEFISPADITLTPNDPGPGVSSVQLKALPRTVDDLVMADDGANYDLQITYPDGTIWTYYRGRLQIVKDVSRA